MPVKKHSFWESLGIAFSGILRAIKAERNLKVQIFLAFLAAIAGLILKIPQTSWLIFFLTTGCVLSAEIFNTCIETICNLLRDKLNLDYYETKFIRDMSAGAVLLLAIISIVVGLLIFLPYFLSFISR